MHETCIHFHWRKKKGTCAFSCRVVSYWPTAFLDSIIFKEYKKKRFRASNLKWEKMLQMQQLWPSGECKTKQQIRVHLQPLAFLKLVLELIYFLLLTLKHNKVHKSISKHSLGIVRWLWRTTTWTSAITEAFRTGMANKKCAQNRTRMTWLGRCRTCTSDKQTFLCGFSQLR